MTKKVIDEEHDDEQEEEYEDDEFEENKDDEDDEDEFESEEEIEEKNIENEDDNVDYDDIEDSIEISMDKHAEYINKENRVSCNRMTRYEMTRILGERIKMLSMGGKPMIKNYQNLSYETIAEQEFILNMIPMKIKRTISSGFEIWDFDELDKTHLLHFIE